MKRLLSSIILLVLIAGCFYTLNAAGEETGTDPSFNGGKVLTDFTATSLNPADDIAADAALLDDGSIIVVGSTTLYISGYREERTGDFALTKYDKGGNIDTSFGNAGRVSLDLFGHRDEALAVAIQPDGKILVGGSSLVPPNSANPSGSGDFSIARFNADGSLDTSFGVGGKVTTDFRPPDTSADAVDNIQDLIVKPDGKILAVGRTSLGSGGSALAMYNSDGSLATGFGAGGKVLGEEGGYGTRANAVSVQTDGRVLIATAIDNGDFMLARYNTNGALDASFGAGGKTLTDFHDSVDVAYGMDIAADGKIVLSGSTTGLMSYDFGITRYLPNGTLDRGFASSGKAIIDFYGGSDFSYDVACQPDGKIIAAGQADPPSTYGPDLAIARFDNSKTAAVCPTPQILEVEVRGKKLIVTGSGFDDGTVILVNGKEQGTSLDPSSPTTVLIGKKAAKKIKPGQEVTLQVRNACGKLSTGFPFRRGQ